MTDPIFWDCVDERAPFGSDEGATAYDEWRSWREEYPESPLTDCLDWICSGRLEDYTMSLAEPDQVKQDLNKPKRAFLGKQYDIFTLDTTILTTRSKSTNG